MSLAQNQKILVAIGFDGMGTILGYRGELVYPACTDDGEFLGAEEIFPLKGFPKTPGIYLWEGEIEVDHEDDWNLDINLTGGFSSASEEETKSLMGIQEPPVTKGTAV